EEDEQDKDDQRRQRAGAASTWAGALHEFAGHRRRTVIAAVRVAPTSRGKGQQDDDQDDQKQPAQCIKASYWDYHSLWQSELVVQVIYPQSVEILWKGGHGATICAALSPRVA